MSFIEKVKHELKEVGIVTLYFLVCFGILLLLKKLFLAEYKVEFNALSAAVIGVFLSFVGFNVLSTINRHLGKGELVRLFFSTAQKRKAIR